MKKIARILTVAAFAAAAPGLSAFAADDKDFGATVRDETTKKACSDCHIPYPPAMLPQASWKKMMGELGGHFGENATIADEATRKHVEDYLVAKAGDAGGGMYAKMFVKSLGKDTTPKRISETKAFKSDHTGVQTNRPQAWDAAKKSWANCAACHPGWEKGAWDFGLPAN